MMAALRRPARIARGAVAAEVTWAQVHVFRLARHHLDRRVPKEHLARAVSDMTGIQAQLMSAAELQVAVRVDCGVKEVRTALWRDKTLVKTWLMRGTLHLVRAEDLPLYSAAMSSRWVRPSEAWFKRFGLTDIELKALVEAIGEALDGQCLSRGDLLQAVGRGRGKHIELLLKSGWGGLLKPVARKGLLCFGPSRGQSVTFVRPQQWLKSWRTIDPDEAVVEVARRYLRAFGPATKADFTVWWGRWPGLANAAWSGLAGDLVDVSVEGRRGQLLAADLAALQPPPEVPAVQLLAAFDPYLIGYSNRDHLFDAAYRSRISRTAGWISPVVLVHGRCAAVWSHQIVRDRLKLTIEPFRRLERKLLPEIKNRAQAIANAFGLDRVEVAGI